MDQGIIQKQILNKAIQNPIFSKEVLPKTPLDIFEDSVIYKDLASIIKRYYQTNNNVLTEEALLTLTEDKLDRMKKPPEEQQTYFNSINSLYEIRDSHDDTVIDEKIEGFIRKHMRMDLLKKAAVNLDNEVFMENFDKDFKEIMMLDIGGKAQEIINIIDDSDAKRRALSTIHQNTMSTGFSEIDNLNGGGLAKGELGMVVASSGTGKCVTGDTLVLTSKGLIQIQDIPEHYSVDKETNESTAFVASYTEDGAYTPRNTSHWYNLGHSKTKKVTTKSGYSVEGTPEHPLLVMTVEGNLEYKELRDMEVGDYLALSKGANMWSEEELVYTEEAYMMALLVADGYLAQDSGLISFSNSNESVIDYYKKSVEEFWGVTNVRTRSRQGSKTQDHDINNVKVKQALKEKGLKMEKAMNKEVPFTVMQSSKEVVVSFLQGMFDMEGSVSKGVLELTTASEKMSKQIQTLLLNIGIRASRREKLAIGYEQKYYRLFISGNALRMFSSEIGCKFNDTNRYNIEESISKKGNTNTEVFPYQSTRLKRVRENHFKGQDFWNGTKQQLEHRGLNGYLGGRNNPSKETLEYILSYTDNEDEDVEFLTNIKDNMMFEPVETVEDSEAVVYDFTVPKTHSFVANGIISHNTMVLTNLATNYTKLGYNVLFIALEELENRMILKFEQAMLRQNKSDILTGGALNEAQFDKRQAFYDKNRDKFGNLFFARYSPRTVTPAKIEQLIADVTIRQGIQVDVVLVDYPDLLRNPEATGNEADDGGKLFEELRRIGQDYDTVMWTASQMNRTAYSAVIRTAEHMEGAHRKKNSAELVLAVNQTPEEYDAGFIRLYADKVRNPPEGPYDKMIGLKVVGSQMTIRDYQSDDEVTKHEQAIQDADGRMEGEFKGRAQGKQQPKVQPPNMASEINSSIQNARASQ